MTITPETQRPGRLDADRTSPGETREPRDDEETEEREQPTEESTEGERRSWIESIPVIGTLWRHKWKVIIGLGLLYFFRHWLRAKAHLAFSTGPQAHREDTQAFSNALNRDRPGSGGGSSWFQFGQNTHSGGF